MNGFLKIHRHTLKRVNFTACKLYLNKPDQKKKRERERDYLTFREEIINKVPGQEIRDRHIDKKEQ